MLDAFGIRDVEPSSWNEFVSSPTLLRFAGRLGLDAAVGLDLLALAGVAIAFLAFVFHRLRNCVVFLLLWLLYLSIYHVSTLTRLWCNIPAVAILSIMSRPSIYDVILGILK